MLKRMLSLIIILIIISEVLISCSNGVINTNSRAIKREPVKISVLLSNFNDPYISLIRKGLEEVQKESLGNIQYTFFNGEGNQTIQNRDLNKLLKAKETKLLLVNLVDQEKTNYVIDRIKENNISAIFFGGANIESIRSYNRGYWIGTGVIEGGILQGQVIVDIWNKSKDTIDKNKDNIVQYVMLRGPINNVYSIERTKYSVLTSNDAGIQTEEIASRICNWSEEEAKAATKALILQYGNRIEMIISNSDSMAIGAVKALQEQGYNMGDNDMTIPVIGFDGIPEAQDLVNKGFMSGTVIQDPYESSKALYEVGINLIYNKNPIEGTQYKFDDTGVSIILPYKGTMINIK